MTEFSVECAACAAEFNIAFDEDHGQIEFCPFCGEELIEELDFEE